MPVILPVTAHRGMMVTHWGVMIPPWMVVSAHGTVVIRIFVWMVLVVRHNAVISILTRVLYQDMGCLGDSGSCFLRIENFSERE